MRRLKNELLPRYGRVLVCSLVLSAASGCGGDEGTQGSGSDTESGGKISGSNVEISIRDFAFVPAAVTVRRGSTVAWTNDDSAGHDVTKRAGPGSAFNSGATAGLRRGERFKHRFVTPGTVSYVCRAHIGMEATITVK